MDVIDVIDWIIIGGAILLVYCFVIWVVCVIAGQYDDITDEQWEKYEAEHADEEDSL